MGFVAETMNSCISEFLTPPVAEFAAAAMAAEFGEAIRLITYRLVGPNWWPIRSVQARVGKQARTRAFYSEPKRYIASAVTAASKRKEN